jgi:putative multiple sugar transport system ATP-binding protein
VSEDRIIKAMVGREMSDRYPKRVPKIGDVIFEVRDWRVQHPTQRDRAVIKGVNLKARKGEIVGIAGLMGSGRTELAMSVFGGTYGQDISGTVLMHGKPVDVSSVRKAIKAGLAYVTEDRKGNGLILDDNIQRNITLANLTGVSKLGVINEHEEMTVAADFLKKLRIRAQGVTHVVANLSGGNQQKVVLSKWLFSGPEVLILDEPTRGIDVGAKYEIYSIINQAVEAGKCVVMISSEMPELLGMCDRVYVMNEGRFVGEFTAEEVSQEKIMRAIMRNGGI